MTEFINFYEEHLNNVVFYYALIIMSSYVLLAVLSSMELKMYMRKNSYVNYRDILASPLAPSISILAPAYNEEASIIDNVRSLLSLHYSNFEVIIINDGSKDNTIQTLIDYYDLTPVDFALNEQVKAKTLRAVYKSRKAEFSKLTVVDKDNGGKSDALNMGLNVSEKDLILCIDVDCIVEQDALLKMVKPFMEERKRVIATGGVVRIANSCEVVDGKLIKVHLPTNLISRLQVLEYIRAFLMGRMAWSRINCLLLISGAMGLFDKDIVIKAGGYNHNTVGEDMELVVRMRRYMHDNGLQYCVTYVPDPLCWTESPSSFEVLGRQRNRWTRGTIETLWTHRDLFFNPRYGLLGMLGFPFWFFVEWLGPILEFLGLFMLIAMIFTGHIQWETFLVLMSMVYAFALTFSTLAVLFEEMSYQQYTSGKDLIKLLIVGMIEPIVYHPITVYWAMRGNIDILLGRKSWGKMTRTGFSSPKKA